MTRALVLVDGEHYPPVTMDALESLRARGFEIVAAVNLGGGEKLRAPLDLGSVPVVGGPSQRESLADALDSYRPEVVLDVSDAPVVDTRGRFVLASISLARGVPYVGADFRFDPPPRPPLTARPVVAVIGTGKRTGKTAMSAALARHAVARGLRPVIVAMGRGGPAEPIVTRGDLARPSVFDLIVLAERGEHAASDTYEDAVVAGVATVGARRAGAGLAGGTVYDTVARAVEIADAMSPDVIILEGSGTAIPPARAGATLLVAGPAPPGDLTVGLGPFRLLIADLVVVTMAEEPLHSSETLSALTSSVSEFAAGVSVVRTVFRPAPVGSVRGKRILFATTAPEHAGPVLIRHLEQVHGAEVVGTTHRLADRSRLSEDLRRAEGTYEVLLTELKAAAVDVAARAAVASGAEVVFADNIPVAVDGDLAAAFDAVLARAGVRG
ncbi:MAG: 2,3-diphosphoglycerate synthetase [Actinomycetota bacterium]